MEYQVKTVSSSAKATEWLNRAIEAGHNTATTKQLQSYLQAASGHYAAIGRDAGGALPLPAGGVGGEFAPGRVVPMGD